MISLVGVIARLKEARYFFVHGNLGPDPAMLTNEYLADLMADTIEVTRFREEKIRKAIEWCDLQIAHPGCKPDAKALKETLMACPRLGSQDVAR